MTLTLIGLALVTLSGFLALTSMGAATWSFWERLALAYGVGLGLFTYLLFAALAFGLPVSAPSIFVVLAILLLVAGAGAWAHRDPTIGPPAAPLSGPPTPRSRVARFMVGSSLALVFTLTIVAFGIAVHWPISSWDALTVFDGRGRALFAEQNLLPLKNNALWGAFPLLTSIGHALVYALGGTIAAVLYPPYYLALLGVFYLNVMKVAGRLSAAVFTTILALTPILWQHASEPLTNLPFAFYFGAGTIYVYRWVLSSHTPHLVLGGLLYGLSSWTRYGSEPLLLAVVIPLALYALPRKRYSAPCLLVLTYAAFHLPWFLYQRYALGEHGTKIFGITLSLWNIPRFELTATYLWRFLTSTSTQGTIWLIFLFLFVANLPKWRDPSAFLALALLLGFGAWTASIYFTGLDVDYLAKSSGERLLLSLIPVAAFYCAVNPLVMSRLSPQDPP